MNTEDYNQISLEKSSLDAPDLMKEGEVVTVLINTEDQLPLSVEMPSHVILEVTHTEPGVKGNTAQNCRDRFHCLLIIRQYRKSYQRDKA